MTTRKRRYFVLRLNADHPKYSASHMFQVQVLDSRGRSAFVGHVGETETDLRIGNIVIPQAVLEAARRQLAGQGDYVNELGQSIPPF